MHSAHLLGVFDEPNFNTAKGSSMSCLTGQADLQAKISYVHDVVFYTAKGSSMSCLTGQADLQAKISYVHDVVFYTAKGSSMSCLTGQADLQAKISYVHDVVKRREAQDQTVKVAISSATDAKRKLVESVCRVQFVHSLSPVFEQSKRQRIQQQLSPSASINKFEWTGDEDTPEEVERLKLRLQALIGWDEFPSDLELRDVHTQMFNERVEDESHRVKITRESDFACAQQQNPAPCSQG